MRKGKSGEISGGEAFSSRYENARNFGTNFGANFRETFGNLFRKPRSADGDVKILFPRYFEPNLVFATLKRCQKSVST